MPATHTQPAVQAPTGAGSRWAIDVVALAVVLVFIGWVFALPIEPRWDVIVDYGIFTIAGVAVGVFQWRVATRVRRPQSQVAWYLLASASFVRIGSGTVWSLWLQAQGAAPRPLALLFVNAGALLLGMAGLLAFTTERRTAVDRVRLGIDATIVAVGSALLLWLIALGPFFAASGPRAARGEDYLFAVFDALSAGVAAVVCLRSGSRFLRTVTALMLVAHLLQVVPDVLLWVNKTSYSYRAGDAIEILWFAVWVLKGLAARYAEHALANEHSTAFAPEAEYRSGPVPHLFVVAATGMLLYQLTIVQQLPTPLSVIGAATLALLLIGRELVEIRERQRLQRALSDEADWYGALLREAYDFVVLFDANGMVRHASPPAERIIGDVGILQRPWGLLDIGHPDDQRALRVALMTPHQPPCDLRYRLRSQAHSDWQEIALHVEDLREDPLVGAIVLNGHDVTRESRLTGRLRQSQELDALGVFAGGLAHDLNNILTVIDTHAELLLEDVPATHAIRADLTAVRSAADRARRLTRGLLALSRRKVGAGLALDLPSVVRARITAAALTDRVQVADDAFAPAVRVDPTAIALAIDAVLVNALEAPSNQPSIRVTFGSAVIAGARAEALEVADGSFAVVTITVVPDVGPSGIAAIHTAWDVAPDNLMMLMALAAIRETGGAMDIDASGSGTVVMFVPATGVV